MKDKTNEELKDIIARAEAELLSRQSPSFKREMYFYSALCLAVKSKGGQTMPLSVFKKNPSSKTLLKNTNTSYDNFITSYADKKLSLVEWNALYNFLISLCVEVMNKNGVDITLTSVLAYTQNHVQDIFNHEFPFWLENKMFPLFIQMVMKNEENQ
jgi:hypothetical protein